MREHHGGFTKFICDISDVVQAGDTASSCRKLTFTYSLSNAPDSLLRKLGLTFDINPSFNRLKWLSKSNRWSNYLEKSIGSNEDDISILGDLAIYRQKSTFSWGQDSYSFYYDGLSSQNKLSMLAKSAKPDIYKYIVYDKTSKCGIQVMGVGKELCRIKEDSNDLQLLVSNLWDYSSLSIGNYMLQIRVQNQKSYRISISFDKYDENEK